MELYPGKLYALYPEELPPDRELIITEAITIEGKRLFCQRCGQWSELRRQLLPNGEAYCPHCVGYGRVTTGMRLVRKERPSGDRREIPFRWDGKRTVGQEQIAQQLANLLHQGQTSLVYAVTGAGKTEMLFSVVRRALMEGRHVCLSAPRIDVCRELLPRLQSVFPNERIIFRYGEGEPYEDCTFLLCTTHQLLHFREAFDLLIIDEIDAFPYEGDRRLAYAAEKALKPGGSRIFLSATPNQRLLQELPSERIFRLPGRYHRRPLIRPEGHFFKDWRKLPHDRRALAKLVSLLAELLQHNHVLLFCPSIAYLEKLYQALQKARPDWQSASVSSQDAEREEKVLKMRQHQYQVLLCTTILERGVTFSQVSVIVVGADHPVYTKSALIQIAGRVDRKGEFSRGRVLFLYSQMTKEIRQACREIQELNNAAKKEDLIDDLSIVPTAKQP